MARKIKLEGTRLRSSCPVSAFLDVVGDKWSLLVIRDIGIRSRHRYTDFQEGAEGIPTNILASRLKRLVELGILKKQKYQTRPARYEYHLTSVGESLVPVIRSMAVWASERIPGIKIPPGIVSVHGGSGSAQADR